MATIEDIYEILNDMLKELAWKYSPEWNGCCVQNEVEITDKKVLDYTKNALKGLELSSYSDALKEAGFLPEFFVQKKYFHGNELPSTWNIYMSFQKNALPEDNPFDNLREEMNEYLNDLEEKDYVDEEEEEVDADL
jgi:hypothetical protein